MRVLSSLLFLLMLIAEAFPESISDVNRSGLLTPERQRWGRDPFARPSRQQEKTAETHREVNLKINGIIADGRKALAIINGDFYRIGDHIQDFVIRDITRERVLMEAGGKRYYFGIEKFAVDGGRQ